jgi:ubiquinone/menaquinone biosynthesis C-methylase UbiE
LPATTRLIATDLNPPMLDVARKKFHPDEPIEFQHADAMELPFADASFDAVVCQFSAQFFPEKEKSRLRRRSSLLRRTSMVAFGFGAGGAR